MEMGLLEGDAVCPGDRLPLAGGICGCQAGYIPPSTSRGWRMLPCEPCSVNTHQPLPGMDECTPCPRGHHQPVPGSTSCTPCFRGTVFDSSAGSCVACPAYTSSSTGGVQCDVCEAGRYRLDAAIAASSSTCMACPTGMNCGWNATRRTWNLTDGWWRHSSGTSEVWPCKSSGSWSPCGGGSDAGFEGGDYCNDGYRGPRCEVCSSTDDSLAYFNEQDAQCHDCGDVTATSAVVFCILLLIVLLPIIMSGAVYLLRKDAKAKACTVLSRKIRVVQRLWRKSGMRFKVKAMVGLYQCIAAAPTVFNIATPRGMEEYARWLDLLKFEFSLNLIIPASCFGSYQRCGIPHTAARIEARLPPPIRVYRRRLLIGTCWPIAVLLVPVAGLVSRDLVWGRRQRSSIVARNMARAAMVRGFQQALPLILLTTFLLVPSIATRIFRTYLCDPFQFDDLVTRRYLREDVALSCESGEYRSARATAFVMVLVWPLGIPLLYMVLLAASREAIRANAPTSLSRATEFLWADYEVFAFWCALALHGASPCSLASNGLTSTVRCARHPGGSHSRCVASSR